MLEAIIAERGAPQVIRSDNGPELTSRHFLAWCIETPDRLGTDPAGTANAERAGGELSWHAAGRMLAGELGRESVRGATEDRCLEKRIQSGTGEFAIEAAKGCEKDGGFAPWKTLRVSHSRDGDSLLSTARLQRGPEFVS